MPCLKSSTYVGGHVVLINVWPCVVINLRMLYWSPEKWKWLMYKRLILTFAGSWARACFPSGLPQLWCICNLGYTTIPAPDRQLQWMQCFLWALSAFWFLLLQERSFIFAVLEDIHAWIHDETSWSQVLEIKNPFELFQSPHLWIRGFVLFCYLTGFCTYCCVVHSSLKYQTFCSDRGCIYLGGFKAH